MQKQPFPVGGSKKFEDWGGGGVKKVRTGKGLPIWGVLLLGRGVSTPFNTCHAQAICRRGHIRGNRYGIPNSHLNNVLHLHLY